MNEEKKHKILKLETKKRLFKSKSNDEIYNTLSDDLKMWIVIWLPHLKYSKH